MAEHIPAEAFPPGEYLAEELAARGWSQTDFAEIIGRTPNQVSQLIGGKRAITPEVAKDLAAALDTSPLFWLNLEAAYRLHEDQTRPSPVIRRRAALRSRFPVTLLLKRGWIEPAKDIGTLEERVLAFYRLSTLEAEPAFRCAARRTQAQEPLTSVQLAWLFRVRQLAEAMGVPAFDERRLRQELPRLRQFLFEPEGVEQVAPLLTSCGVRFVIVEHIPASKIDGVCFWLDSGSPVIGMSLRLDRIDNFWFVLAHELAHVLYRHAKEEAIVDTEVELASDSDEDERIANQFAADFCVPAAAMRDFLLRNQPMFRQEQVLNFARYMHLHPGLVIGQIQRHTGRWELLRPLLVKVRHLVVKTALTDGYGQMIGAAV